MSQHVLQVNFTFSVSLPEYEAIMEPLTGAFATIPGCRWKIWLMNEKLYQAGGFYLFDNQDYAEQFCFSPLMELLMAHPALSNFSIKGYGILEKHSLLTRAPLLVPGTKRPSL
jgi:hypothetical protein